MNAEKFFRAMYTAIWQSNDLSRFDVFYAKDFEETIDVSDENKQPITLRMNYDDLAKAASWQKESYKNTTIPINKLLIRH